MSNEHDWFLDYHLGHVSFFTDLIYLTSQKEIPFLKTTYWCREFLNFKNYWGVLLLGSKKPCCNGVTFELVVLLRIFSDKQHQVMNIVNQVELYKSLLNHCLDSSNLIFLVDFLPCPGRKHGLQNAFLGGTYCMWCSTQMQVLSFPHQLFVESSIYIIQIAQFGSPVKPQATAATKKWLKAPHTRFRQVSPSSCKALTISNSSLKLHWKSSNKTGVHPVQPNKETQPLRIVGCTVFKSVIGVQLAFAKALARERDLIGSVCSTSVRELRANVTKWLGVCSKPRAFGVSPCPSFQLPRK